MPPSDDGLFDANADGGKGAGAGDGKPQAGAEEAARAAAATGLNEQQVEAVIQRSLQPLGGALNTIADFMEKSGEKVNPDGDGGKGAGSEWLEDPAKATERAAKEAAAETKKEMLGLMAGNVYAKVLDGERSGFDDSHGDGKFDEVVLPFFQALYERMAPEQRADEGALRNAIGTIKGHPSLYDKLYELRVNRDAKREEADEQRKAQEEAGMMTGGFRRAAPPDKLTPDEKDFITRWNKATSGDHRISEKEYLESRGRFTDRGDGLLSSDESAWSDAFTPEKQAGASA